MQEQTRTKVLAGLLLGTVVFYFFEPHKKFSKPLQERKNTLARVQAEHLAAEKAESDVLDAMRDLRLYRKQSLPPDPLNAQVVYRDWLYGLAEECGLGGPNFSVEPKGFDKGRIKGAKEPIYAAVGVKIEAEATLTQLTQFVYRIKKAGLMHRIKNLQIDSDDTEGDPYLDVVIFLEGLSIQSAGERLKLFAQSDLKEELDDEAETIPVADLAEFPTQPGFLLKSGDEYMEVTAIDSENSTLTVKRAVEESEPATHEAGTTIEQIPIAKGMENTTFADYEKFLAASPFVKPQPEATFDPSIDTILKKKLVRGEELDFTVTTSGFNPEEGAAVFRLKEGHPEGMAIDEKSGKVTWSPGSDVEVKEFNATVLVSQEKNEGVDLSKDFVVAIIDKNNEPKITVPRDVTVAYLGRLVSVDMKIEDETPGDRLKFQIEGVEDAYIDSKTNALMWQPREDLEPGEYTAKVTVTDSGDKKAEAEIRFNAIDDAARYTKFTAAFSINNTMQAMLFDQINNRRTRLKVGSTLTVADITGSVKEIDTKGLLLTTEGGDMRFNLGDDLRTTAEEFEKQQEAKPKEQPALADPTPQVNEESKTGEEEEKADEK